MASPPWVFHSDFSLVCREYLSIPLRRSQHIVPSVDIELMSCQVLDIVEFPGPPKLNQTLWPDHCVQGTWGAKLHEDLEVSSKVKQHDRSSAVLVTDALAMSTEERQL